MISTVFAESGVGNDGARVGMSRASRAFAGDLFVAAAHPVHHAYAARAAAIQAAAWRLPAAAIPAPRKRRAATATFASVDRGST